jgi:uncharacterized protein YjbI with pentapeptide repeats
VAKKSAPALEKLEVRNRWTGNVQFTAEFETTPLMTPRVKLGLAVQWGYRSGADLRDADLRDADLRDADLRDADLSGADLRDADLRDADLSGADLRDADLRDADLSGADLSGADLRGAVLRGADLRGADLSDADLSGADLRGAVLRDFPVKIPNIHQAVFAAASAPQALDMATWHKCETAHCRAGWVTTLAGDGGKALEWMMGPAAAAALIYAASDPTLEKVPNFYATNEEALADMKRLAEQEAA